jgi:hypothetical protein
VEEIEQVKFVDFKLTTARYQGMMDEEYNEEDIEIMKVNSERNLMNSKVSL